MGLRPMAGACEKPAQIFASGVKRIDHEGAVDFDARAAPLCVHPTIRPNANAIVESFCPRPRIMPQPGRIAGRQQLDPLPPTLETATATGVYGEVLVAHA